MNPDEALRMAQGENSGDIRAPVASLCSQPLVAQLLHELHPNVGDAKCVHARLGGAVRETVSGKRRNNHIKCVGYVSTVACGVSQHGNHFQHFKERAGPAMSENQWNWCGPFAARVDEMDTYTLRGEAIVLKGGHFLN